MSRPVTVKRSRKDQFKLAISKLGDTRSLLLDLAFDARQAGRHGEQEMLTAVADKLATEADYLGYLLKDTAGIRAGQKAPGTDHFGVPPAVHAQRAA
jgi:hypothetical protein